MISTLMRINWLNLKRDYVALGLTFVLPIVFFAIFAAIFGGMSGGGGGGSGPSSLRVIVVDEDNTETSGRFVETVSEQDGLRVSTVPDVTEDNPEPRPYTAEQAVARVREGGVPAVIIIPAGFGGSFGAFGSEGEPVQIVYDAANPLAQHTVSGLLQAAAFQAAPDVLMESGMSQLEQFGGGLTAQQQEAMDLIRPYLRGEKPWEELDATDEADDEEAASSPATGVQGLVNVETIDARSYGASDGTTGEQSSSSSIGSMVAYYAAGIGVMFLLFSMAGAAGTLIEEEERGTLERVLSTRVSMTNLLLGQWSFFAIVGVAQLAIMFVFGALVFGLDLFTTRHLTGFIAMTLFTAGAAAAFGMFLATLCRTRGQLSGLSTIVILIMSALGGSMVPRFVMPEFMNTTALFTFNGWAMDGYLRVFWYGSPGESVATMLGAIVPQLLALTVMTFIFLAAARLIARRWEAV